MGRSEGVVVGHGDGWVMEGLKTGIGGFGFALILAGGSCIFDILVAVLVFTLGSRGFISYPGHWR